MGIFAVVQEDIIHKILNLQKIKIEEQLCTIQKDFLT